MVHKPDFRSRLFPSHKTHMVSRCLCMHDILSCLYDICRWTEGCMVQNIYTTCNLLWHFLYFGSCILKQRFLFFRYLWAVWTCLGSYGILPYRILLFLYNAYRSSSKAYNAVVCCRYYGYGSAWTQPGIKARFFQDFTRSETYDTFYIQGRSS